MKKYIFIFTLLFVSIAPRLFSQTYLIMVKSQDGLWGFMNLKGEMVIQPKYEKLNDFSKEGLAPIYDKDSKKFYFINLKGETLQTEITDMILPTKSFTGVPGGFSDGLAAVGQGKKWGYIDAQGKTIIHFKYDKVSDFNDGYAIAVLNGKFIVIDKQGTEASVTDNRIVDIDEFSEKLAAFKTNDKKMGFINENGKIVIEPQYEDLGKFCAGLAWAKSKDKVGYIDHKGDWVFQPVWANAYDFDPEAGACLVKLNDTWTVINLDGQVFTIQDNQGCRDFSNGLAWVRASSAKIGFINSKGEWAIQPQFDKVRNFKNGYATVKVNESWGLIDKTGEWILKPIYNSLKDVMVVEN